MYQLAEHYSEASRLLEEQAKGKEWGCSAPQLLVDSFAVELYLKCLFVLDTNIAPLQEHDWEKLFDALLPTRRLPSVKHSSESCTLIPCYRTST
jgi:hypothetical protein